MHNSLQSLTTLQKTDTRNNAIYFHEHLQFLSGKESLFTEEFLPLLLFYSLLFRQQNQFYVCFFCCCCQFFHCKFFSLCAMFFPFFFQFFIFYFPEKRMMKHCRGRRFGRRLNLPKVFLNSFIFLSISPFFYIKKGPKMLHEEKE